MAAGGAPGRREKVWKTTRRGWDEGGGEVAEGQCRVRLPPDLRGTVPVEVPPFLVDRLPLSVLTLAPCRRVP